MEIKEALLKLKEDAICDNIEFKDDGICHLLSCLCESSKYGFVKENCGDWNHFSGDLSYPVSSKEVFSYHRNNCDLWNGEQLELRLSLIDHLLTKC